MPSKSKSLSKLSMMNNLSNASSSNYYDNNQSSTSTSTSYWIRLIVIIISIGISYFILDWLVKVNKCKCANIEEALYLKEWYMFLIAYQIIIGIYYMVAGDNIDKSGILLFITIILSIIAFVMIVRLLIFIHKLKEIKCDCGMSVRENIIYYWYIVVYSIILFLILLTLIGAIFLSIK